LWIVDANHIFGKEDVEKTELTMAKVLKKLKETILN
jgi:hypothetical protein